jgi:FHS family glucose/mannose:H+ symporter-like MFS transporter
VRAGGRCAISSAKVASGLGAAALPSLIGAISTHTGSLRIALTVPVAAALAMLLMSFANPKKA